MRKHHIIALCLCALVAAGLLQYNLAQKVRAESSEEIRDQIGQLESEGKELQEKIDSLEELRQENLEQLEQIVKEKQVLDQQISLIQQQITNTQEQIRSIKLLIADKQEQYDEAAAAHKALNEKYIHRIRAMEERGELSYWSIVFHANTFTELLDRMNMMAEIAAADRSRLGELRDAAQEVSAARDALAAEQAALQDTLTQQRQQERVLSEKRGQSYSMIQKLMAMGEEFDRLLDMSEQEQQALLEQIAKKEEEFDHAAYLEWLATYVPPTTRPTVPPTTAPDEPSQDSDKPTTPKETEPEQTEPTEEKQDIVWVCPVSSYKLTSPFGMREHPIYGDMRMHNGIDMQCPAGTPIYATRSGQVTIAQWSDTAGNYVQINHGDGYRSVYMHMTHYVVSVGQFVAAGQVIGYVGNTGVSEVDHLHFGVSFDGAYINPYPLIA